MKSSSTPFIAAPRWRKLARDLAAEKSRMVLMVAAITVSLVAVGGVLGAYSILTREIAVNYLGTHPADATLEIDSGVDATVLELVRKQPEVAEAEARDVVMARMRVGEGWRPLLLFVAGDFRNIRLNTFRSESGAWPPSEGGMLVERSALPVVNAVPGQAVLVKTPNGAARDIRVEGIVHDPGLAPAWQERMAYGYITPATLAALGEPPVLHELRVAFVGTGLDERFVEARAAELAKLLGRQGHEVHEVRVPPLAEHPHQKQMTTLLVLMLGFALMALVLSGILVATSLAAMLARQVREIGVMKTIGAQTRQIAALYRTLVGVLGAVSVLIAMPAGIAVARLLSRAVGRLLNFDLTSSALPWWVYATQLVAGVIVPVAIAAVPIRRASRITVREAIEQHGVSTDMLSPRMSSLPFALRNALRRPTRLALTLGLLASGGAMFMTALNVSRGWERNLAKIPETRFYDFDVRLHAPVPVSLADQLRRVEGVARVEAWGFSPAAFVRPGQVDIVRSYPDRGHGSLSLMAPPAGTPLVRFPVLEGRWLEPGDTSAVVLNHTARAQLPGIKLGDEVAISLDGQPSTWRVVGIVEEVGSPGVAYVTDQAFAAATGTAGKAKIYRIVQSPAAKQAHARIMPEIESALAASGAPVDVVIPLVELSSAIGGHVQILILSLVAMAIVMAIVGMLGLGSTMSINVIERTREIGVMTAIGATPRRILRTIAGEAAFIAGASGVLALGLAVPLTAGLDWLVGILGFLAPLPFVVAGAPIAYWTMLLALVTAMATLLPASRASSITVREALAHL